MCYTEMTGDIKRVEVMNDDLATVDNVDRLFMYQTTLDWVTLIRLFRAFKKENCACSQIAK